MVVVIVIVVICLGISKGFNSGDRVKKASYDIRVDGDNFTIRDKGVRYKGRTFLLSDGSLVRYYVNSVGAHITNIQFSRKASTVLKIPPTFNGVSLISIKDMALRFAGRPSISIEIPEGVEQIGRSAFDRAKFNKVIIPSTVKRIGSNCFSGARIRSLHFKGSPPIMGSGNIGVKETTLFYDPNQKGWTEDFISRMKSKVASIRPIDAQTSKVIPDTKLKTNPLGLNADSVRDEDFSEANALLRLRRYGEAHRVLKSALNKIEDPVGESLKTLEGGNLNEALGHCYESVNDWALAALHYQYAKNHYEKVSAKRASAVERSIIRLYENLETIGLISENRLINLRNAVRRNEVLKEARDFALFENRGDNFDKIYLPDEVDGFTGWVKILYADEKVKELTHYKQGWKSGLSYTWYENGVFHLRRNFHKGTQNGLHQEWSKDKKLITEKIYSKGEVLN